MIHNDEISTLADLPTVQARQLPDNRALVFRDEILTYSQLELQSNRLANALLAQGVREQSRVALLAKDSLNSYVILFACAKIKAVLVTINWRLAAPEVSYILRDANVETLFIGAEFHSLVTSIRDEISNIKTFISLDKTFLEKTEQEWLDYSSWHQQYSNLKPDITISPIYSVVQMRSAHF
ncbi:MAG: AMP-binding protein, partial [Merismopedia sp. SIO2A8]|nr:AMP-binding protein [Merismopedia sp. SIO2A8]